MTNRGQRIRELAHPLWEQEGRPRDQEKRHWEMAERIVDAEEHASPGAGSGMNPERRKGVSDDQSRPPKIKGTPEAEAALTFTEQAVVTVAGRGLSHPRFDVCDDADMVRH